MNAARHRYWQSYIADLQERMLLADWEVRLLRRVCDPDGGAQVAFVGPYKIAEVSFSEDFESFTRAWQRRLIVHELIHLYMQPMRAHLGMQFSNWSKWDVLNDGHRSHEEYAVDQLARLIAPHMPLPPKVKA